MMSKFSQGRIPKVNIHHAEREMAQSFKAEYSKRYGQDIWGVIKSRRVLVLKTDFSEETLTQWSLLQVYAQISGHFFSFNILYRYSR